MVWMIFILLVLSLAAAWQIRLIVRNSRHASGLYFKNSHLFSPAERSFFGVLNCAIGSEYALFAKVRTADVLSVAPNVHKSRWHSAFNKIKSKHFDFVICQKTDFAILGVIELDDTSHKAKQRAKRDIFLNELCATINLPLFRFTAKATYVPSAIREQILTGLQPPKAISHEALSVAQAVEPNPLISLPTAVELQAPNMALVCPKCALPLVQRTAKTGANVGKQFMACTGFPRCRYIAPG